MLQGLSGRHAVIVVVNQKFSYDIARFWILRNQLRQASALLLWKVELHVARHLLKLVQKLLLRRSNNIMNFVDLVEFVGTREERRECQNFKEDTADAPVVHLVIVVSISQQTLRRSIPPG